MRTKFRLTVLVVAATVVLTPSAAVADPAHTATQAAVNTLRSTNIAPGAGVVARNGADLWSVTSGTRMLGQNFPFLPEHRVRVGSLTKPFTAAIVLQHVAEGRVDLDASVETYLPGVVQGNGYDGNAITVRQLLNHTSGVNEYLWLGGGYNPVQQLTTHTLAEVAGWGLAQPPLFPPGTAHQYSNTNYILAGMIIEAVSGRTYQDELVSRIINPLGLTGTYLPTPGFRGLPQGHVRGYVGQYLYLDVTELIEPSIGLSGGGLVSTGADATRFFQALLGGEVVTPALLAEMMAPNGAPNAADPTYGLGLTKLTLPCGGFAWGHYGIWPGYRSLAAATTDGRSAFATVNVLNVAELSSAIGSPSTLNLSVPVTTALCE